MEDLEMKWIAKIYEKVSDAWYRMRLKNDNFTIITDTCIGGVMYHKLGKQFLSPTINLWMYDEDFYKIITNVCLDIFNRHLFKFIDLSDDYTEEEANKKWVERTKRIYRDNLFIICADLPNTRKITHEDMVSLKDIPCRGKVVFSIRKYDDIDYIVPLPKDPNGDYVNSYMFDKSKYFQRYRWEEAFDWVHWLNTGEVKLRK